MMSTSRGVSLYVQVLGTLASYDITKISDNVKIAWVGDLSATRSHVDAVYGIHAVARGPIGRGLGYSHARDQGER